MPILGPLADFSGVSRDLVVTAYQSAQGLTNLVNPADMILPAIAIANVSFGQWLRFVGPVLVVLIALAATVLVLAAHVGSP